MAEYKMNIEACAKSLAEARSAFEEVNTEKEAIEKRMTAATNRLNDAQKTFDEAVAQIKKDAPWNTKWHSERNPSRAAL